jgi:transposase
MSKALSLDLRERVLAAIAGGMSRRQAALRFGERRQRQPLVLRCGLIGFCSSKKIRAAGTCSTKRYHRV